MGIGGHPLHLGEGEVLRLGPRGKIPQAGVNGIGTLFHGREKGLQGASRGEKLGSVRFFCLCHTFRLTDGGYGVKQRSSYSGNSGTMSGNAPRMVWWGSMIRMCRPILTDNHFDDKAETTMESMQQRKTIDNGVCLVYYAKYESHPS